MNIQEHAFQLTAYERGGFIDIKDYMKDIIKEQLSKADFETLLSAYNEYCSENCYEEFMVNEEETFNTYFDNMIEVVRATQYGNYNFYDEYVKFNGYGNLDSYDEAEIEEEITTDNNFIEYILDRFDDYDFIDISDLIDDKEEIIKETYNLVKQGY